MEEYHFQESNLLTLYPLVDIIRYKYILIQSYLLQSGI
jgi:hypothetical protein